MAAASAHVNTVHEWLESLGLEHYIDPLVSNGYDELMDMPTLTAEDLHAIGIEKSGPLLLACSELKAHASRKGALDISVGRRRVREGLVPDRPPPRTAPVRNTPSASSSQTSPTEAVYENVSFSRDQNGKLRALIGEVELSGPALQYISEPSLEPKKLVGLGMSVDGLTLMLRILQQQEEEERKQIDARFQRMKQRISRVLRQKELGVLLDPTMASLGVSSQVNAFGLFFHGRIDRAEAESRLKQVGRIGSFLLREKDPDAVYVLSFIDESSEMAHVLIERACNDDGKRGNHFTFDQIHLGHCRSAFDVIEEMFLPVGERRHRLYPMQFEPTNGVRNDEVGV